MGGTEGGGVVESTAVEGYMSEEEENCLALSLTDYEMTDEESFCRSFCYVQTQFPCISLICRSIFINSILFYW